MNPLFAFGLPSGPDLIVIMVIVLVLFGAKKLPELARGLGQSLGEFKKAKDEFEREIHKSAAEIEVKEPIGKELATKELPAPTPADKEPPKTA